MMSSLNHELQRRSVTESYSALDPQASHNKYEGVSRSSWAANGSYALRDRTTETLSKPPVDEGNRCSLPPIRDLLGFQGSELSGWAPAAVPLQHQDQTGRQQDIGAILNAHPSVPALNSLGAPIPITPPVTLHKSNAQNWSSPQSSAPAYTFGPSSQVEAAFQTVEREHRRSFASTNSTSSVQTGTSITSYSTSATSAAASSPGPTNYLPLGHYNATSQQHAPQLTMQGHFSLEYTPRHQHPASPLSTTSTEASPTTTTTNPDLWQHHSHYLHPETPHSSVAIQTASSNYPQDRYVCPTCSKAFSRPSSLRIHSHSHTGEKPFRCPQKGCGKAFSVRSNMKRHERGCHVERRAGSDSAGGAGCREILPAGL